MVSTTEQTRTYTYTYHHFLVVDTGYDRDSHVINVGIGHCTLIRCACNFTQKALIVGYVEERSAS
jgi:hypothetical protein